MDILYVCSLCSKRKFGELFESSMQKPAQQVQKYHRLMTEGLVNDPETSVQVLSALPINQSISSQAYYKNEVEAVDGMLYRYLPFVNRPLLRQIFLFLSCLFYTVQWCLKHKQGAVMCDVLNITMASAALIGSKLTRRDSLGIVTDVPAFLAGMSKSKLSMKDEIVRWINTVVMNHFGSYVFLTEYMNQLINKERKPYVVIEGQVDNAMADSLNELQNKSKKKICMYAGQVQRIYGIKLLTDAFITANVENSELHIYGMGDFADALGNICREHPNINYFGVVPNELVVREQARATLLINPRPSKEEYTKYSFPSKNLECMASGTPLLSTDLPCMPEEYRDYVFIAYDETVVGFAKRIKTILQMQREELHRVGIKAKEFVLAEKNNIVQAKKVLKLLSRECNDHTCGTGKRIGRSARHECSV